MRRLLLIVGALALAPAASAADVRIGRLFFTPAERAALEDARRRNIRAEEIAAQAAKQPAAPRSRKISVTGVILRSDGESVAWINGKSVDGKTSDGLRVRHTAQPNRVLVYDPDKGRMVQVKVGQRADLLTGRVEESYERRKRALAEAPGPELPLPEEPAVDAGRKLDKAPEAQQAGGDAQARRPADAAPDPDAATED